MAATHTAPRKHKPDARMPKPIIVRMSDVRARPVSWLWPEIVPMARLTLLSGEPGIGKSVVALDMAARVTRGRLWPASQHNAPHGNVVLLSPRDHAEETVRSRLEAAGANAEKVVHLHGPDGSDERRPFSFPADLPALEQAVRDIGGVRVIIVDPLSACVGGSTRSAAYRNALTGLADLAARTGAAVVAIVQFSGKPGTAAFRRSRSNADALTAAKSVWHLTRDRQDPDRVLLMPVKCNLTAPKAGLAFRTESSPDRSGPVLGWEPEPVPQAHGKPVKDAAEPRPQPEPVPRAHGKPVKDEPVRDAEEPRPRHQRKSKAARWLHQTLSARPRQAEQVRKLAARRGIKGRELKKARASECVVEARDGSSGQVTWALPAQQAVAGRGTGEATPADGVAAAAPCS
jgi:hypothetical protein